MPHFLSPEYSKDQTSCCIIADHKYFPTIFFSFFEICKKYKPFAKTLFMTKNASSTVLSNNRCVCDKSFT